MTALIRTPLVLPLAAAATFGLFVGMRALIDIGEVTPAEPAEPLDVVLIEYIPDREPDRTRAPDWVEPAAPPPPPEAIERDVSNVAVVGDSFEYVIPAVETGPVTVDSGIHRADGSPVPVVRIQPVYPARLSTRGVEGQCTVLFDITPNGTTANVRIMSCSNSGFESASTTAVQRWRYNPQVENGEAVMFRGATTQLVYRLDT
jgi:protein TonB